MLPPGTIFVVDSMSGFGALPLDCTKIDYVVSSANKCIPGVPGFAFVLARREVLLATKGNARSVVLDLLDQFTQLEKTGQFRFTPPTHALVGFATALAEHKAAGGVTANLARFAENHRIVKEGLAKLGFYTFIADDLQSPIITAFLYPSDDFNFEKFYDTLGDL